MDNHAVLCIFFVLYNWRRVKYKKSVHEWDETIVNDCDKWLVFGDTISRKKKKTIMFFTTAFSPTSLNSMTRRELKAVKSRLQQTLRTQTTARLSTSAGRTLFKLPNLVVHLEEPPSSTSLPRNIGSRATGMQLGSSPNMQSTVLKCVAIVAQM